MRRLLAQTIATVLLSAALLAQQKSEVNLPTEETVNSFMQQTFGYDPSVTWKIASIKPSLAAGMSEVVVIVGNSQGQQVTTFYVTGDGKHALVGDMIPFGARPYQETRDTLEKGLNGVARGPADAKVTIVEFSDLQCPHCKDAQPVLDKLLMDEPGAKFVFQQFPLASHNWAGKAAAYADCIGRTNKDAFWKFVQKTFDEQNNITESNADEKLTAFADEAGAKGADAAACAAKPDTKTRLDQSVALGTSVGVTGTPTVYINGRRIANVNGLPYEILKNLVEYAGKQQ
jgi:protein-disulfide isomerase